jgi:hypothetical protein
MPELKIEALALNIGGDRRGNEAVDRQTGLHAVTNFSGRYIDSPGAGQAQNRLVLDGFRTALEEDELDASAQLLPAMPFVETSELIRADQPGELGLGKGGGDLVGGVDGVGGARSLQLAAAKPEARLALEGQTEHGEPLGVGGVGFAALVGRLLAGHKEDGVEAGLLKGIPGKDKVAVVHGIERSAKDAEPQTMSRTLGHRGYASTT